MIQADFAPPLLVFAGVIAACIGLIALMAGPMSAGLRLTDTEPLIPPDESSLSVCPHCGQPISRSSL